MVLFSPRPFLIGQFKRTLTMDREWMTRSFPNGPIYRVKYLLVDYPVTVEGGIQTSPDLSFNLYDADGRSFSVSPILFKQATSPAGFPGLNATQPINLDYYGGSTLKLEILGFDPALGLPGPISITIYGLEGWTRYGR